MAQPKPVQVRSTRAEIHHDALSHNLGVVRRSAGGAQIFAVVKANAYGHGLVETARALVREGAHGLAVALPEEGFHLRDADLEVPVLVLNGIYGRAHERIVAARLTPVVYDVTDAKRFAALGVGVHLKVDTGMTRLGTRDLGALLDAVPNLRLDGLMTHLSSAEDDDATTDAQLDEFERAVDLVRERGHRPTLHAANSAGTLLRPRARYDLVRPGVALYGVRPTPDSTLDLRPVMRLVAPIARVVEVSAGTSVGYSRTWTAARRSRIATLAIGYGDGYPRALSNRGEVIVRGVRCPVVGNVSMDLTGVDVTEVPACRQGDEAVLIGDGLRPENVADRAGTIAYELLCSISERVPRRRCVVTGPR